jgi:hypothetical protein
MLAKLAPQPAFRDQVNARFSVRINNIIKRELLTIPHIDIYTAIPTDLLWKGLPVHGSAGLELGLIKKFALPWNLRSAGSAHDPS